MAVATATAIMKRHGLHLNGNGNSNNQPDDGTKAYQMASERLKGTLTGGAAPCQWSWSGTMSSTTAEATINQRREHGVMERHGQQQQQLERRTMVSMVNGNGIIVVN
jgi:hypothetical protein